MRPLHLHDDLGHFLRVSCRNFLAVWLQTNKTVFKDGSLWICHALSEQAIQFCLVMQVHLLFGKQLILWNMFQANPQARFSPNTYKILTRSKKVAIRFTPQLLKHCLHPVPHLQPVVLRMGGNFRISAWQSFTPWWPDPLHRRQGSVCQPRASPHLVMKALRMDDKLGRKLKHREFCWTRTHSIAEVVSIQVVPIIYDF